MRNEVLKDNIIYVSITTQPADILTKALGKFHINSFLASWAFEIFILPLEGKDSGWTFSYPQKIPMMGRIKPHTIGVETNTSNYS